MRLDTATAALNAYLDADVPAFIWGAPGVGKSDSVRAVAKARNLPLIDVRAVLLDPVDLRGLPHVDANGRAAWAPPAFLPEASRDGAEGLFFMDELNAAPASVQAACFQLVLDRKLGEYTLPPGWRIVAAGNRQSDRAAAQRMPTALANRFAHIDVEADADAWATWAAATGLNPLVLAFIRWRPALLHIMPGAQPLDRAIPALPADARAFPTPRAWAQVAKVANAPDAVRMALVSGLVGEGAAAEFEGFVRTWRALPALDLILSNPHAAPVPSEPAAMYAVTAAIARKADRNTFANVLAYAARLPREFEIVAAVDAVKRDPSLAETSAFTNWAIRNQDIAI